MATVFKIINVNIAKNVLSSHKIPVNSPTYTINGKRRFEMTNIKGKIKEYLSLRRDKQSNAEIIEAITSGTQFKGTSLWVLICAIFIASLGLNMNSTAVIIGAMLISPLMGPIMGVGLGVGIGDNTLIRSCLKNLLVATLFSLLASAIYFFISPINEARSELLARTQPTIYDVMIAFFGGFAGIIATGSKSKGNILPGVAIATALMPPLCTAGYGLATFQWRFFSGALYLFLINAVYIGLATWLGTKVLRLPRKEAETEEERKRSHSTNSAWAFVFLVIFIIPSIYTTIGIVRQNIQDARVSDYIQGEFEDLGETHMISYELIKDDTIPTIQVNLLGATLDDHSIDILAARMGKYGLDDSYRLKIVQGNAQPREVDADALSSSIMKNVVQYYNETIDHLRQENDSLRNIIKETLPQTEKKDSSSVSQKKRK